MQDRPELSVIMPAYNAAAFIGEAIESLLVQDFENFELLIIDDGSSDNTCNVVLGFQDPRIKLIRSDHVGIPGALNLGLNQASAELVVRFDADDISLPNRLTIQYNFMRANPDYVIAGSDAHYVDREGRFVYTYVSPLRTDEDIREALLNRCPFIHSSVIYRRKQVLELGGYDQRAITFQDHLLWRKLLVFGKGCNLPEVLLKVRMNPHSISIDERWRPKRFHEIRQASLVLGELNEEDAGDLSHIIKGPTQSFKLAAYHCLIGKKYLWNNYQPAEAREAFLRSIRLMPARVDNYLFLMLSYLPPRIIQRIYQRTH